MPRSAAAHARLKHCCTQNLATAHVDHCRALHIANGTGSTLSETFDRIPRLSPSMQLEKGASPASARLCGQRAAQQVLRILAVQAAAAHAAAMRRCGRHTIAQVRLRTRPRALSAAWLRAQRSPSARSQGNAQAPIRVEGLTARRAEASKCQAQRGRRNKSAWHW